jgi:hypothetical protein
MIKLLIGWLPALSAMILFGLSSAPAFASPCDTFDIGRLDPGELMLCIREIKSSQEYSQELHAIEINTLKAQLCILALKLAEANPSADNQENAKDFCPKRPTPKAPKNKRPVN